MKRICFIELEGILASFGSYVPDEERVKDFLDKLSSFSKSNGIEVFLLSGYHEDIVNSRLYREKLKDYFDEGHFLCVDDNYISSKIEMDAALHRESLKKNPDFVDSYFKQVVMQDLLKTKSLSAVDAVLLSDDIWVDGYYSTRFSKIDFAIFEENILDRGRPTDRISGLAYFNLGFDSVKRLLENFPETDTVALEKYVFESLKKALLGEDFTDRVKKGMLGKKR